jgi:hypothetical protein
VFGNLYLLGRVWAQPTHRQQRFVCRPQTRNRQLAGIEGIAAGTFGLLYLPVIPRKSDKPTATH